MGSHTDRPDWTKLLPTGEYLQNKETSEKGAPAVVRWGEPPMLKLAKRIMVQSKNTDLESMEVRKRMNTFVRKSHGFI